MGFLEKLKEGIKQAGRAIASGAKHVWQGVKEVTREVRDTCREGVKIVTDTVHEWGQRIEEQRKKRQYIRSVKAGHHQLVEEKPDKEVKEKTKELMDRTFHGDVVGTLKNKTAEERIQLLDDFGKKITKVYGVDDIPVEIGYPTNYAEMRYCGSYNDEKKRVFINAAYVESENPRLAAEQVFTIIHEVNHARQWATIRDYEKFGYSPQRAWELALNQRYYIRPDESDRAYRMQPVEAQSFELEEELKQYCNVGPINE